MNPLEHKGGHEFCLGSYKNKEMENFKEVVILERRFRGQGLEMGKVGRRLSAERHGDTIAGARTLAVEPVTLMRHLVMLLTHLIL